MASAVRLAAAARACRARVPERRDVPPKRDFSIKTTVAPMRRAASATAIPDAPAPIKQRSGVETLANPDLYRRTEGGAGSRSMQCKRQLHHEFLSGFCTN